MSKEEQIEQEELRMAKHKLWATQRRNGTDAVISNSRIRALEWVIREAFMSVPMICERPVDCTRPTTVIR